MAIFSRRTVQQMLNENAEFLTKDQLDEHVKRLNRKDFDALETEWEVAVLNAFSKLGNVQHEPDLGGAKKLDLLFVPHKDKEAHLVADVATVSDEGFEDESPVKTFEVELYSRITKAGLSGNGFGLSIGSQKSGKWGEKPKVLLPPRGEFNKEIFNSEFKSFLNRIKQYPDQAHSHQILTATTSVMISYTPGKDSSMSTWPAYTQAMSKRKNPVYNALKLKAQGQFKKITYDGPRGIILCDGGSDMVHGQPHSGFKFNYNAIDAIKEFLRQNQSIDFVLMLSSVWINGGKYSPLPGAPVRKIQATLVPNSSYTNLPEALKDCLTGLEQHFHEPINTASGARETIRYGYDPKALRPLAGGIGWGHNQIQITASAVIGLLAGRVTQEELFKALRFKPHDTRPHATRNLFEAMLSQKMRIVEIQIEDTKEDDSYLIFKFDGPDPAISPFINPKAKK